MRSFGPGIVIVLTWLGAGDVVDMGAAGANYGYALLWVFVVAILFRFLFVSLIARYHLCNQHGEGVLDGLARLHPLVRPGPVRRGDRHGPRLRLLHDARRGRGLPQRLRVRRDLAVGVSPATRSRCYLVFRPSFRRLELVFFFFLAVLSVSFVGFGDLGGLRSGRGCARSRPGRDARQAGAYDPAQVALAMIGAVGGSLMNLVYPYFLDAKGWRGPEYRRVQLYDFLLGMVAMLVLNLAIWVLGAELLYPDRHIQQLDDLPQLLSTVLGEPGRVLFYAGIFAAIYTSIIGHAAGLGRLGTHAWLRWRAGTGPITSDYRHHACFRWIAVSCLVTPLVWTLPGMPGFRRADARRQQRPGRAAAAPRRRAVVDHGERAPHRPRSIATAGGRTS